MLIRKPHTGYNVILASCGTTVCVLVWNQRRLKEKIFVIAVLSVAKLNFC